MLFFVEDSHLIMDQGGPEPSPSIMDEKEPDPKEKTQALPPEEKTKVLQPEQKAQDVSSEIEQSQSSTTNQNQPS